jgi:FlaA1/EpsC-like NDP-sugar epimerase
MDEKPMKTNIRSRFPNGLVILADIIITVVAITAAFALRLAGDTVTNYIGSLYWMILISLLIKPAIYYFFGLYRRLWAYASINELTLISAAVTVASAVFSAVMLILFITRINGTRILNFPRTILPIDWLLSLVGIGGLRFSVRLLAEGRAASKKPIARRARNVLIIGAGDAGALVVRELPGR